MDDLNPQDKSDLRKLINGILNEGLDGSARKAAQSLMYEAVLTLLNHAAKYDISAEGLDFVVGELRTAFDAATAVGADPEVRAVVLEAHRAEEREWLAKMTSGRFQRTGIPK
jgi:hypothetical protein